jgi:putative inorganic carbon (hco3(-)) transporter
VAAVVATARAGQGVPAFETLAMLATAAGACLLAWHLGPAWPASIGISLSVFSGNWSQLGVSIPLDRLLIAVALAVAAARYVSLPEPRPRMLGPVHGLLALTALLAIGSALWVGTLGEPASYFGLLDRLGLIPFVMFAAAPLIFVGSRERAVLLGALVVTGAYLGLTALFEAIPVKSLVLPSYIRDETIGIHQNRARGPFLEAAAMGMALCACGVAAAMATTAWRARAARLAAVTVTALCAMGILFTLTRSTWIGAAAGAAAAMLVTRRGRRAFLPVAVAAAVLIVASIALIPGLGQRAGERKQDQATIWDRENLTTAAVNMIDARPLLGFGWGTFQRKSADYFRQSDGIPMTASDNGVHNYFLALAVDLGIIGVLCWVAVFFAAVWGALRQRGPPGLRAWQLGFIAVAVDWLVVANFIPLSFAFPTLLLWTWAGVLWAGRERTTAPAW